MAFLLLSFGGLFQGALLLTNAIAILSEDRFLARIGWTTNSPAEPAFGAPSNAQGVKSKLILLISSIRALARVPLMFINALVIIYILILG